MYGVEKLRRRHVTKRRIFCHLMELDRQMSLFVLTFTGPCSIVIYSYNESQQDALFLKFIFGIELYMFRTVFLSIIRNLVLYTQQ